MIAEALVRSGIEDIVIIDFDSIEKHNLDCLAYATRDDVGKLKVEVQAEHLRARVTANPFTVEPVSAAVYDDAGFRAALDCDVLFSCVDRPWGRYVLNLIAYAHLIPVIDGGISVRSNRLGKLVAADWKAHTVTLGRECLQCLRQYDPSLVQTEREGLLEDPSYIEGLPQDHPLKARQNVFAFSMSCASMQMLQMLALVLSPLDQPNQGTQLYHFVGGFMEESRFESCNPECQFPSLMPMGDRSGVKATRQCVSLNIRLSAILGILRYIVPTRGRYQHNRGQSMAKQPGLDSRHRDVNGQTREKNGNTRVDTLRRTYGDDFAPGVRGDAHLGTVLERTNSNSLSDYPGSRITPRRLDGHCTGFVCIHSYDLPAPCRNALSQLQVWPGSTGQMGELRLWDDSSVHRFASAVVAGASIAGLRGES